MPAFLGILLVAFVLSLSSLLVSMRNADRLYRLERIERGQRKKNEAIATVFREVLKRVFPST